MAKYVCDVCGWEYDEEQGAPDLGIGQLLLEADIEVIKAAGLPTITPMLICNTDDYPTFNTFVGKDVTNEDVVIALAK